jgi:methylated-DNA-[protein]-cysteine S-methyltransferase
MTASTLTGRRSHTVVDSPVGPITLLATDDRLTGLYLSEQRHPPAADQFGAPDDGPFAAAAAQLSEYFAGRLTGFDLPVTMTGTAFQRLVWRALRDIPYGTTVSYGELAAAIGARYGRSWARNSRSSTGTLLT